MNQLWESQVLLARVFTIYTVTRAVLSSSICGSRAREHADGPSSMTASDPIEVRVQVKAKLYSMSGWRALQI